MGSGAATLRLRFKECFCFDPVLVIGPRSGI